MQICCCCFFFPENISEDNENFTKGNLCPVNKVKKYMCNRIINIKEVHCTPVYTLHTGPLSQLTQL